MAIADRLKQIAGRARAGVQGRKAPAGPGPALRALHVTQDGSTLVVTYELRPGLTPVAVWSWRGDTETWRRLGDTATGRPIRAEIAEIAGERTSEEGGATAQLYLEVLETVPSDSDRVAVLATRREAELTTVDGQTTARYRMFLGGRQASAGDLTAVDGLTPYLTRKGGVAIAVDRITPPAGIVYVDVIHGQRGVLYLRGRLNTRHCSLLGAELVLKSRATGRELRTGVTVEQDEKLSAGRFGAHWYRYRAKYDWALADIAPEDDIFDAWMDLRLRGFDEPHRIRVGKARFVARMLARQFWALAGARTASVMPYFTVKANNVSFRIDLFEREVAKYLRTQLPVRRVKRIAHRGRPIWLVGERPTTAQENGFALFRHLRATHPEIDAYYVIDPAAPDYAKVAPLGNVVAHGSREHVRLSLLADRVVGSHHPDYLYPVRTEQYRRAVGATRVFLQHGVTGMKWMVPYYGKGRGGFESDLIVVNSEREKQMFVRDFRWAPSQVTVAGFPRFDSLFAGDVAKRRQLMIMPTWREWLHDVDRYLESEYHERWSTLLHDPRLHALADRYDFEVVFCLHPNTQKYSHLFADAPARVISQGDVDIQRLLKESSVLITDYSSVAFDFAFLDRPVVLFQFDRERALGSTGGHIDVDAEAPGTVVRAEEGLLAALERIAADDFAMQPGMRERADVFLDHRDRNNCERVVEAVKAARREPPSVDTYLARPLPSAVKRRWRRSRYYFPMMKLMFRALSKLPVDENRVVFESDFGKRSADNPRMIYEELARRGSPLRKIWSCNTTVRAADDHTEVVPRLSPAYFRHMARAKYWVTNQNLPYYLTRREDGAYVQMWHGTPLKRMMLDLLDQDQIHGRDAGYVDRMRRAASQWSLLVSPSPYASKAISGAYGYTGPVLEVGYPRNDLLASGDQSDLARRIRERIGIPLGARTILYAPTFRDDQGLGSGKFKFELPFDLQTMYDGLGPDTVLLLRMHVVVANKIAIPEELRDRIIDVSRYPAIQELCLVGDVLVTDYSSVFFDYALLRRPIVFYAYDLDNYRDNLRGFYLDYLTDLPGPIVSTEDELLKILADPDQVRRDFGDRYDAFLTRFAPEDDGSASARVVDAVFGDGSR